MRSNTSLLTSAWLLSIALSATTAIAEETREATTVEEPQDQPVVKAEIQEAVRVEARKDKPPSGWKEVRRDGVLYWCRKATPTGSRVRTELECATPAQYRERTITDRSNAEQLIRTAPGPKGG